MTINTKPAGGVVLATLLAGLAYLAPVTSLGAATLANADRQARTITIIKGAERSDQQVKAGGLIEKLCPDGCIVRIDKDPKRDFVLEGRERVTIEDGLLYYDGELAPQTSKTDKAVKR